MSKMPIQNIATFSDSFRDLIKRQNYEKYVLTIINRSTKIFPKIIFTHIEKQSHGESDFQDSNGQCYDAKLLFDKKQGALIGEPKNEIILWLQEMINEKTEFGDVINNRDVLSAAIAKTKLYQIMKNRIASIKPDEHGLLFIPFPIVDDYEGSIHLQFATDFLQAVYDKLVEEDLVGNRRMYFIYPSVISHVYVLRDDKRHREYIHCEELDDFITYESRIARGEIDSPSRRF